MKTPTLLASLFAGMNLAYAADPAPRLYKGEISGIACAACSKKVKTSLEKLPGVKAIKLSPNADSGVAKIEITSTSADITKEAAIKALGKAADEFTIISLEEAKAK